MKNKKFIIKSGIKISFILLFIAAAAISIRLASIQIKKINSTMIEKKKIDYIIQNRSEISTKIQNQFSEIDPSYEQKIIEALPSVYNILPLVEIMEKTANDNDLEQQISFGQPEKVSVSPGPLKISSISFTASLHNVYPEKLLSYLDDFERLPYFVSINSLSLNGQGANGWLDNSSVNISGKLYARE